jgi:murein DD-endopeptidase MepM/ murein hydrolase activator NlpD
MFSYRKILKSFITSAIFLGWMMMPVLAAPPSEGPLQTENFIYTVRSGDALVKIALHYNLTLSQIILANHLTNPNLIFPGQHLILPGIPPPAASAPEISPINTDQLHTVQAGETLAKIANHYGVTIGAIILANNIVNPDLVQVGQTLKIPSGPPAAPELLPAPFSAIGLSEPTISQGRVLVVRVTLTTPETTTLSGSFEGHPLFFSSANGYYWTIVPIHALAEPNIYPISLTATLADGSTVTTFKNVNVIEGPYGLENITLDERRQALLDPELIEAEWEKLTGLWSQVSPRPRWEGPFWYPVDPNTLRVTSYFGTRRTYNDSEETGFHGGTDFGGDVGTAIYAPAAGRVVLAEKLTVRGNAVLIDHGMGLFSGYWHQSHLAVTEGQEVQQGDLIGYIGDTGLVTGPHLHWEMRLNGIAVEPLQWVQQAIP